MSIVFRWMNTAIIFLREVKMELKKTSFPSREVTIKSTVVVIIFSLGVALFLGSMDVIFTYLLGRYIL